MRVSMGWRRVITYPLYLHSTPVPRLTYAAVQSFVYTLLRCVLRSNFARIKSPWALL